MGRLWLERLGEACEKTGWRIHAWVMMNNHYHLLLETLEANLVAGMKWLQGTYTQRYNPRHEVFGHLFQGHYKAVVVEPEAGNYFAVVSTYIHLNPARAGLIRLVPDEQPFPHGERNLRGNLVQGCSGCWVFTLRKALEFELRKDHKWRGFL